MQFFGKENIGTVSKLSDTTVKIEPTQLSIGGQGFWTKTDSFVDVTTNGIGGLDTGSMTTHSYYYIYAVISSGSFGFVVSLNSDGPTGFLLYKQVGLFWSSYDSNVYAVFDYMDPAKVPVKFVGRRSGDQGVSGSGGAWAAWSMNASNIDSHGSRYSYHWYCYIPGWYNIEWKTYSWNCTAGVHYMAVRVNNALTDELYRRYYLQTAEVRVGFYQKAYLNYGDYITAQMLNSNNGYVIDDNGTQLSVESIQE